MQRPCGEGKSFWPVQAKGGQCDGAQTGHRQLEEAKELGFTERGSFLFSEVCWEGAGELETEERHDPVALQQQFKGCHSGALAGKGGEGRSQQFREYFVNGVPRDERRGSRRAPD